MTENEARWAAEDRMSAWEALMWKAEPDRRTRSTGILLELLDGEPTWDAFVGAHRRAVATVPRLAQRVIEPAAPMGQPVWAHDPYFQLEAHLRQVQAPAPGGHAELLAACEDVLDSPIDQTRPPWQAILVTGLAGGGSAYLLKVHHSLADGVGLMQLVGETHGVGEGRPPVTLTADQAPVRRRSTLKSAAALLRRGADQAFRSSTRALLAPAAALRDCGDYASSLRRMLTPPEAGGSALLAERRHESRLVTMTVPLEELKAAGRSAGCSVNDAYVAAILGAVRRYHERHGSIVKAIPIGMPVSVRKPGEPLGGNKFAGVRFSAPVAEADPVARMQVVRQIVSGLRQEPALQFLDHLSVGLSKLPSAAIIELTARLTASADLNVSNIPGSPLPLRFAGCNVIGMFPLGPRPGIAGMAAMITYNGACHIGANVDAAAFVDVAVFEECLHEGFDEVLALGDVSSSSKQKGRP